MRRVLRAGVFALAATAGLLVFAADADAGRGRIYWTYAPPCYVAPVYYDHPTNYYCHPRVYSPYPAYSFPPYAVYGPRGWWAPPMYYPHPPGYYHPAWPRPPFGPQGAAGRPSQQPDPDPTPAPPRAP